MKKAKFILAAVAVMAVVGGSFAFKASASRGSFDYFTTSGYGLPAINVVHNALPAPGSSGRVYWTIAPNAPAINYSVVLAGS